MSDSQIAELYERLVAGKRKPTTAEYPFNRGWNAGLDFAIRSLKQSCDEPVEEPNEQTDPRL